METFPWLDVVGVTTLLDRTVVPPAQHKTVLVVLSHYPQQDSWSQAVLDQVVRMLLRHLVVLVVQSQELV
jgi:hypothetical protein